MTNEIKEKLLKEIEKYENQRIKGISERLQADHLWFLRGKLQQHEEDIKEFNKILEADILLFEQVSKCLDCEGCKKIINKRIEEIKQRIKDD